MNKEEKIEVLRQLFRELKKEIDEDYVATYIMSGGQNTMVIIEAYATVLGNEQAQFYKQFGITRDEYKSELIKIMEENGNWLAPLDYEASERAYEDLMIAI
jgi:hypothetical protein